MIRQVRGTRSRSKSDAVTRGRQPGQRPAATFDRGPSAGPARHDTGAAYVPAGTNKQRSAFRSDGSARSPAPRAGPAPASRSHRRTRLSTGSGSARSRRPPGAPARSGTPAAAEGRPAPTRRAAVRPRLTAAGSSPYIGSVSRSGVSVHAAFHHRSNGASIRCRRAPERRRSRTAPRRRRAARGVGRALGLLRLAAAAGVLLGEGVVVRRSPRQGVPGDARAPAGSTRPYGTAGRRSV